MFKCTKNSPFYLTTKWQWTWSPKDDWCITFWRYAACCSCNCVCYRLISMHLQLKVAKNYRQYSLMLQQFFPMQKIYLICRYINKYLFFYITWKSADSASTSAPFHMLLLWVHGTLLEESVTLPMYCGEHAMLCTIFIWSNVQQTLSLQLRTHINTIHNINLLV
jgi:hypothetical protein